MYYNRFENYFDSVTKGKYRQYYSAMRKNFYDADRMFAIKFGNGVLNMPKFHDKYLRMVMDAMRVDGAPETLRREVSKRARAFFKINFGGR